MDDRKHPAQGRRIRLQLVTPLKRSYTGALDQIFRIMAVGSKTERESPQSGKQVRQQNGQIVARHRRGFLVAMTQV
jgi:hypothetical protein